MDTYAEDLLTLVEALDLKNAVHVGHSTGGGEVARYIGRYGTKRVAKAALISAVPPLMLKTPGIPAVCRLVSSMGFEQESRPIDHNSSKTSACLSSATTAREPRHRME